MKRIKMGSDPTRCEAHAFVGMVEQAAFEMYNRDP